MVRDYERRSDQQKWSQQALKNAVAKVRDREMSLTQAAVTYGIPKTTLFRRARKQGGLDDVTKKGLGRYR